MQEYPYADIAQTRVLIRGGGDLATGVAHTLCAGGFQVCLLETEQPMAVRRTVSFCEAVHQGAHSVEGLTAVRIQHPDEIETTWKENKIPLRVDPENTTRRFLPFHVLVDATMAKRNMGTRSSHAPLVIGMGPGFCAGEDVHAVVETKRGHHLGRVITQGPGQANTGIPETVNGYGVERVLRAPCDGRFTASKQIGEAVSTGEQVAQVNDTPIRSSISGTLRGILKTGTMVTCGVKAGDVDPRGDIRHCFTISDKARALGGAVLTAILSLLPGRLVLLNNFISPHSNVSDHQSPCIHLPQTDKRQCRGNNGT